MFQSQIVIASVDLGEQLLAEGTASA